MARLFSRARTTSQLRNQLMRQLENEAEKMLKQMTADFTKNLSSESQRVLKDALSGFSSGEAFSAQNMSNLFSTAINYVVSRPRTSTSTAETMRSKATDRQFRLSRAQNAAEATAGLARGEKNS